MQKNNDNRVLGRRHAHDVSAEDLQKMQGNGDKGTLLPSTPFHPDF